MWYLWKPCRKSSNVFLTLGDYSANRYSLMLDRILAIASDLSSAVAMEGFELEVADIDGNGLLVAAAY